MPLVHVNRICMFLFFHMHTVDRCAMPEWCPNVLLDTATDRIAINGWWLWERKEHFLKDVHRQISPTEMPHHDVFSQLAVCLMHDISDLCSGTCNSWASLNWQHCCSHPHEPCSPTHMPSPLPVPTGIIETI